MTVIAGGDRWSESLYPEGDGNFGFLLAWLILDMLCFLACPVVCSDLAMYVDVLVAKKKSSLLTVSEEQTGQGTD